MSLLYKLNSYILIIFSCLIILYSNHKIKAEQTIQIYADGISIDKNNEKISAFGDAVAVNQDGIKVKAEKIEYFEKEKQLNANGNIIINDEIKNTYFLNELTSTNNLNNINGNNVKIRLNDDSRIVGSNFKKENNIIIVEDTEFTPCKEDNYLIKNCPGWKLKAKKVYHDSNTKTIYYDHAKIHLLNIPVFYLPYFSHPDPSVNKRSGFLMPTIQTDNQLGDTFSIPIFLNLSSNKDLTFTPNLQSSSNNFYSLDYRYLNKNIRLDLDTSIDDNNDGTGTSNHLFLNSTIYNNYGDLNAYLKTTNNDTYMRKNNINNLTVLKSGIDFKKQSDDVYFSLEAIGYKHLTSADEQWEYLYPEVVYNINNIPYNFYEGNISLNNEVSYKKNLNKSYVTIASSQLNWENQRINKNFGLISKNKLNFRLASISIDEKINKDTNNLRFYPQVSSKISYPLLKSSSSFNQTLTPIVMPIIAPYNNYTDVQKVTNSNLFSSNRAASITEWESGPRINYGVEWFINTKHGANLKAIVSQNYRFNKDKSDNSKEISNYFINSNITINSKNYLDSSLIIDRDDLKTRSLTANSFNKFGDLIISTNYDYTSGKYEAPAEQLAVGGKYSLDKNLFLKFTGAKNLDTNKNIGYQYGILYENDCLGVNFNYYRDLTKDRDIEESDGFSFTVVLKPFGSTKHYGKNKVFGPEI